MPSPGDVYAVRGYAGPAPLVCLLRCEEDEDVYRGVIVLSDFFGEADPGEQGLVIPSAHTLSKNVYVAFMDLSVPVDPASLEKRRVDFVCGDSLVAARMVAQDRLTGGFDRRVVIDSLDTDDPESDVEDEAFDAAWGFHTLRKCEIDDGATSATFFTGRGRPCYDDGEFGGNARDHAQYVTSLAMRGIGEWEGAPDTEPAG